MITTSAADARRLLYRLLHEVSESHEPIQITGRHGNAVLVAEEDWRALQETLHLCSIPGMRDSVLEGLTTPVCDCAEDPDW